MGSSRKMQKVLVAMGLDTSARREMLSGIFRFVNSNTNWSILYRQTDALDSTMIEDALKEGVSGILASELSDSNAYNTLQKCALPALVQRRPNFAPEQAPHNMAWVETDNVNVGRCGAEYLMSIGRFACYAFIPPEFPDAIWARQRKEGFCSVLKKSGNMCQIFPGGSVREWISSLKLPAAVFCAYDQRSLQVLSACIHAGMKIPSHLAILGVDNDELLCATAPVSLSSISLDHEAFGFDMIAMLARSMKSNSRMTGLIPLKNIKIVERESTKPPVPADVLIRRALDHISQNATHGLTIQGLIRHMAVSERLLYLRFRELLNTTPGEAILDAKLKTVVKHLHHGREKLNVISDTCGFRSRKHLSRAFKKHFGMSMREYRILYGKRSDSVADRSNTLYPKLDVSSQAEAVDITHRKYLRK